MIGTFVRLAAWSMKNRALARLRRLRQPRYLAGLVLGLAYFYWLFVRNQLHAARGGQSWLHSAQLTRWAPDVAVVAGLILWVVTIAAWVAASGTTWRFSGAEVQFLYTAPVPRRSLLHYKLLRGQIGTLFGVLVGGVFSGAIYAGSSSRWAFVVGGWLLFATLGLHLTGISLAKNRLRSPVSRRTWQAWMPPAIVALLSLTLVIDGAVRLVALPPGSLNGTIEPVFGIARSGLAGVALWPYSALAWPILSSSWRDLVVHVLPVLGLAALNYAWVLRADSTAADATLATEQRRAGGRSLPKRVVRAQPFALAPAGRPEIAVVWKNLILLGRYASVATLVRWVPLIGVVAVIIARQAGGVAVPVVAALVAAYATVLGPMMLRNDLRQDLPRLRVLKTWPVTGSALLAGELAAPTLALSAVVWSALAVALAASGSIHDLSWTWWTRLAIAVSAVVLAPALIAGQVVIHNGAVVLLPGWIPTGDARPRGIEAMGQNLIAFAGTMLAFVLGLLPAALIGGAVGAIGYYVVGVTALPVAAVLMAAVLFAEIGAAVLLLGRLLARTEPTQVESGE